MMRRHALAIALSVIAAGCGTTRPSGGPDTPFVSTPTSVVTAILTLADVKTTDVVYDLGSGDGRVVIAAARDFSARGVGVEIDPKLIDRSNENAFRSGVSDKVRFVWEDLFKVSVADATVVTLYLLPEVNLKLRPKLLAELRPGARIVSHDFSMGDWAADRMERVKGPEREHVLHYWVVPAGVEGDWRWSADSPDGSTNYQLRLRQRFQSVSGMLVLNEGVSLVRDATLAGNRLAFTVITELGSKIVTMKFAGQVIGDRIAGTVDIDEAGQTRQQEWTATRRRP
jgi:SAM-dependent methyltransferase